MNPSQQAGSLLTNPWLVIIAVFLLFFLLRTSRKLLRKRVDEIGYRSFGERGLLIWFWLNAPGVILHELSHAIVVLFLYPFGFRITSITFFRVKPKVQVAPGNRVMRQGRTSLQLGEVQYVRPHGKVSSYIGDGLSAIAPLFGGILVFFLLYWMATGYALWDVWHSLDYQHMLRPGWPWWTLTFTPYLILTVTSELWPSHQDWRGARWLVGGLLILGLLLTLIFWIAGVLVFNNALLLKLASISAAIDFTFLVLLLLDVVFLLVAEVLVRAMRH